MRTSTFFAAERCLDAKSNTSNTNGFVGKVKQVVHASDATLYALSIANSTTDAAGSIAYSITPTSSSNDVKIDFFINNNHR